MRSLRVVFLVGAEEDPNSRWDRTSALPATGVLRRAPPDELIAVVGRESSGSRASIPRGSSTSRRARADRRMGRRPPLGSVPSSCEVLDWDMGWPALPVLRDGGRLRSARPQTPSGPEPRSDGLLQLPEALERPICAARTRGGRCRLIDRLARGGLVRRAAEVGAGKTGRCDGSTRGRRSSIPRTGHRSRGRRSCTRRCAAIGMLQRTTVGDMESAPSRWTKHTGAFVRRVGSPSHRKRGPILPSMGR